MRALDRGRRSATIPGIAFRDTTAPCAPPARAGDPRPRRLSHRLGADRPRALQLLGRHARRRGAVLARLPASVQLLRPARLLDALAPPRSGAVRRGDRAAAPRARRARCSTSPTKIRPCRARPGCAFLEALIAERCRPHSRRLDPRRRHRARCRHPASLQEGRLAALPAGHGEHRRADARTDPQGRQRPRPTARRSACCASTASCRWRPGWSASRRRPTAIIGAACGSSCPTIPTRSRCSTSRRTAGRRTSRIAAGRRVIQTDRRRWDYKHQVLATRHMAPWRVLALVQVHRDGAAVASEGALARAVPPRPRTAPRHALVHADGPPRVAARDPQVRVRDRRLKHGPTVAQFWGAPQDAEEEAMTAARAERRC